MKASARNLVRPSRCEGESGEVFPVAILFGGVLLTILIGVHVVLVSVARTAAQSAADRGVIAVQGAPLGPGTHPDATQQWSSCGEFTDPASGTQVRPTSERECQGVLAVLGTMNASISMVGQARPPAVTIDDSAGVVSVLSFGSVVSPVLGVIEVTGYACGPLDLVEGGLPSRADVSAC